MKKRINIFLLLTLVFVTVISLGLFIYSTSKSNKEEPKRGTLVQNILTQGREGVV